MAIDDTIPNNTTNEAQLRTRGLATMRLLMPGVLPEGDFEMRDGGFGDELLEMGLVSVWGQMWARSGLSLRDRSLVTMALLIAKDSQTELKHHIGYAITNGVTREEIEELIYHSAGYIGFPPAVAARNVARSVLDA